MAFTGTATVKRVSERMVRITGLSLAASAAGTISLFEGSGSVKCPDDFNPEKYSNVTLQDSVALRHLPCVPITVAKAGTTQQDFLLTMTNQSGSVSTGALEIYIEFH